MPPETVSAALRALTVKDPTRFTLPETGFRLISSEILVKKRCCNDVF